MFFVISASLCWFLSVSFLVSASEDQTNITAEPGKNAILPCQAPRNTPVIAIEWTKPDLGEEYVLFYRDGHFDPENQSPSFKNRVELNDNQMKDGDASLILKDVSNDDTGIYECHVILRGPNRRKRASFGTEPVRIINLTVQPGHRNEQPGDGGNKNGHLGLTVGLGGVVVVIAAVVAAVVDFMIFRKRRLTEQNSDQLPADDTVKQQLV